MILSKEHLTKVLINTLVSQSENTGEQYMIKDYDDITKILSYYRIGNGYIKDNEELYTELKQVVPTMDIVYINIKTEDILYHGGTRL